MSAEEIIREANELARSFYALHGCVVPDGYRFDKAHHPHELMMWQLAVEAYDRLRATSLDDVLTEIEDDE
jgi:hypothetical protein